MERCQSDADCRAELTCAQGSCRKPAVPGGGGSDASQRAVGPGDASPGGDGVPNSELDAGEMQPADAGSSPLALPEASVGLGIAGDLEDRCQLPEATPGTAGNLEIKFRTESQRGLYAPANVGAVWFEDSHDRYVATLLLWAGARARNLFRWDARRCDEDSPDVISRATLADTRASTPPAGTGSTTVAKAHPTEPTS